MTAAEASVRCFCGCGREIDSEEWLLDQSGRLLDGEIEVWFRDEQLVEDEAAAVSFVNEGISHYEALQGVTHGDPGSFVDPKALTHWMLMSRSARSHLI